MTKKKTGKLLEEIRAFNAKRKEDGLPYLSMKEFKEIRHLERAKVIKVGGAPSWSFYYTKEWKELRYQALVNSNGRCMACGASAAKGAELQVDHIIPISKAPERKNDPTNLQCLCRACNWGKGKSDQTDWRERDPEPDPDPRYGKLTLIANNGK